MADRLELTGDAFTSRAVNFMNLMRTPAFRREFDADPAGTASREFQLTFPARAIGASNELLAALLKDRAFNKWARQFQTQIEEEHPELTKAKTVGEMAKSARAISADIQREFAEGALANLSPELASRLTLREPFKGQIAAEDDIALVLLVFVAIVVVVVAPLERGALLSRNTVRLLANQLDVIKADINR